jgi:hypothetical protein
MAAAQPGYATVLWLDRTFKSRSSTEALLRPDLESGLITEHDYQAAANFLPRWHRYWPVSQITERTLPSDCLIQHIPYSTSTVRLVQVSPHFGVYAVQGQDGTINASGWRPRLHTPLVLSSARSIARWLTPSSFATWTTARRSSRPSKMCTRDKAMTLR